MIFTLIIGCKTPKPDTNVNDETNMVLIPAGEFLMGNKGPAKKIYGPLEDELPLHTVYLDAFYIDKYEVANADFKKFLDANPQFTQELNKQNILGGIHDGRFQWEGNNYPEGEGNHPANVSWYEAMAYAKWVGKRLPTEAEWEKAARGGLKNKTYPWGESSSRNLANFEINPSTVVVGSYEPNDYGLYDVAGNVSEWCLDEYQANFYMNSPQRNPIAGAENIQDVINNYEDVKSPRVLRGGGWVFGPDHIRVSKRWKQLPGECDRSNGFRCVKSVDR